MCVKIIWVDDEGGLKYIHLLLTLRPYKGLGLLHQIIPETTVFNELATISQLWFL